MQRIFRKHRPKRDANQGSHATLNKSDSELWLNIYGGCLHVWPFRELCEKLQTSSSAGLTTDVAEKRLARCGKNKFQFPEPESKPRLFLKNCSHGFSFIILLSSILCFITYYLETLYYTAHTADREYLIAGTVLLMGLLLAGTYQYMQADDDYAVIAAFNDLMPMYCTVIRDGRKQIILSENVVLGDVLAISFGERLSADVRFFSSHGLEMNNVALMGLSKPEIIDPTTLPNSIRWV